MSNPVKSLSRGFARTPRASTALQFVFALLLGDLALALSAHLQVPFWPVPVTMETFVVMTIGLFCSPAVAIGTVGAFLLEGLIGMPVFAHGGGPAYLLGPTGGYLIGYVLAAGIISALMARGWGRSTGRLVAALTLGDAVIFVAGFAWLSVLVGPEKAWVLGVAPFLLGDGLKIALATATARVGSSLQRSLTR